MSSPIDAARDAFSRGQIVLCYLSVKKVHDHGGKGERALVITDQSIAFYKSKTKAISRSFPWISLSFIEFSNQCANMKFGDSLFRFESDQISLIKPVIFDLIQRIFNKAEISRLNVQVPRQFEVTPTPRSIISRIRAFIASKSLNICQDDLMRIINFVILRLQSYSFSDFLSPIPAFSVILDALPLISSAESISLPFVDEYDEFHSAISVIHANSTIQHFVFYQSRSSTFSEFMDEFSIDRTSKVNALTFSHCGLSERDLDKLASSLEAHPIKSLSICDSCIQAINNHLFTLPFAKSLIFLDLSDMRGINLESILPSLPQLRVLSVENCHLEISEVLKVVSAVMQLSSINMSGNQCAHFESIPNPIPKIVANRVDWTNGALLQFLRSSLNTCSNLAIGNAKSDNWNEVAEFLGGVESNISSLDWSGNPISKEFFEFLKKCPNLASITIDGAIDNDEKLETVCKFLNEKRNLSEISMRRSKANLVKVIGPIMSIQRVDISFSDVDEAFLSTLSDSLLSPSLITYLRFEGTKIQTKEPLLQFAEKVGGRKQLFVSFPVSDVQRLGMNFAEIEKLMEKWRAMDDRIGVSYAPLYEVSSQPIVNPESSPLILPLSVTYWDKSEFPKFLNMKELEAESRREIPKKAEPVKEEIPKKDPNEGVRIRGVGWDFPLPDIPLPNDSAIDEVDSMFSISSLLKKIKANDNS